MYFQLIILLGSGIIGTGHHYYWIGTPEAWMGLGSVFSALEVIPLSLLMVEAYAQYKVIRDGGIEMFRPRAVAIERYRYRGTKIPTPWSSVPTTGSPAPAA